MKHATQSKKLAGSLGVTIIDATAAPRQGLHLRKQKMNDQAIEQEIIAKGKTAPRITPEHIQATIKSSHYFTAHDGVMGEWQYREPAECEDAAAPQEVALEALHLLTFCVLVLQNGFTVTGESACASPENFDAEIGRKIARQNAEQKIWALEGYVLKCNLAAHNAR